MKTSESANANPTARSRGRIRWRSCSRHFGMPAAKSSAPISDVIESQRQGNCTSDNLGTIAHTGLLRLVAIRNVSNNNTKAAVRVRLDFSCLKERSMNTRPGKRKPIIASARMLAYQVFRFVSAEAENRKFRR